MESLLNQVEAARQAFLKLFRRTKLINNLALGVMVLGMAAAFMWILPQNLNLALIIVAALVIVLFVYSRMMKAWLGKKAYEYIFAYYRTIDAFFFHDEPFSDINVDEHNGFELTEFQSLKVLKHETSIISRNKVSGMAYGRAFTIADAGVRVTRERKVEVAFFGKIISFPVKHPVLGRITYFASKSGEAPLPEGLNEQRLTESVDGIRVFSSEEADGSYDRNIIKALKKFSLDEDLADVTLVTFETSAFLLLSYSDAVMGVVYERPANRAGYERFSADLAKIAIMIKEFGA